MARNLKSMRMAKMSMVKTNIARTNTVGGKARTNTPREKPLKRNLAKDEHKEHGKEEGHTDEEKESHINMTDAQVKQSGVEIATSRAGAHRQVR